MSLTKCKKCGKKINDNVKKCPYCSTKERNNKVMPIIIDVLKVIVGSLGAWLLLSLTIFVIDNIDISDTSDDVDLKYEACRSESNAFYKCSWSILEDRCVCEFR